MKLVLLDNNDKIIAVTAIAPKDITTHVADGGNTLGGISPELRSLISNMILTGWAQCRPVSAVETYAHVLQQLEEQTGIVQQPLARVLTFDPCRTTKNKP